MSEFDCSPSDVLLVADQIARRMAHKWAHRNGFGEGVAEDVLDEALPILWAQRVERVPLDLGELYAKAIALVSVQKGRKIQYGARVLERAALAEWAARRSPRSQFVGDDGGSVEAPPFPVGDLAPPESWLERFAFQTAARMAYNRLIGYSPMRDAAAYHA